MESLEEFVALSESLSQFVPLLAEHPWRLTRLAAIPLPGSFLGDVNAADLATDGCRKYQVGEHPSPTSQRSHWQSTAEPNFSFFN